LFSDIDKYSKYIVLLINMPSLKNLFIRRIMKQGTSISVTLPPKWGKHGEHVALTVKDDDTIVISKKLG